MNRIDEVETGGIDVHPFAFYPEMIQWKLQQKNNVTIEHLHKSLAISIIIDCACLIEGVLNIINKELLQDARHSKNSLQHRLLTLLEQRLEKGQFSEYTNIYSTLVGREIKVLVGNESWKSIVTLFSFRNNLVHGNVIEITEHKSNRGVRVEVFNTYKRIYEYLLEKKLIDVYTLEPENLLFNESILSFFYESTIGFIRVLVKNAPKRSQDYIREMTTFLESK
ncbi:hypothetical protein [Pontibacter russatus]|uniref:hypothetical protein n=1 Tax=Pontibacter russatus TaxID=2694929 RepID=UPI00137ACFE6|nr:hypothetical protein [Pontibacter russatus]